MKKTQRYFLFLIAVALCEGHAMAASSSYDFTKINATIEKAISPVVKQFRNIKSFTCTWDPTNTDVAAGKLSLATEASFEKAAWSKDPVKATAVLTFKAKHDGKNGLELTLNKKIQTDGLTFIQYVSTIKHKGKCPVPEEVQGVMRVLAENECTMAEEIEKSTSISELRTAMETAIDDTNDDLPIYIKALQTDETVVKDKTLKSLIQAEIKKAQNVAKVYAASSVSDVSGGFEVKMGEMTSDLLTVKNTHKVITDKGVIFATTLQTSQGAALYEATKPGLEKLLKSLEAGETYGVERVKSSADMWLRLIDKLVLPTAD